MDVEEYDVVFAGLHLSGLKYGARWRGVECFGSIEYSCVLKP